MQHTQPQFRIDRSGIRLNSKVFAQTGSYEEQLSSGESLWRGQTRAIFFKKMKTEQDATGMFGNPGHWLNMHLMLTRGRWREVGLLCACVGKIYRGPAESNIAECANSRFRPPFFFVHYPLVKATSLLTCWWLFALKYSNPGIFSKLIHFINWWFWRFIHKLRAFKTGTISQCTSILEN